MHRSRRIGQHHFHTLRAFISQYRRVLLALAIILLLVILGQFLYPRDRALPFSQINNQAVGVKTKSDITKDLRSTYRSSKIEASVRDKKLKKTLSEAGLSIDYNKATASVTQYPWWQRIIPLSVFIKGVNTHAKVQAKIDKKVFTAYAKELSELCKVDPTNAAIAIKEGRVVLKSAKNGTECTQKALQSQIEELKVKENTSLFKITTTSVAPERSDKDVQPLLGEAKKLVERKITISLVDTPYVVPRETLASWVVFHEDAKTKKLAIALADDPINAYLQTIQKDIYIAPGVTTVRTVDGSEVSRSNGANGRGIDAPKTIALVKKQALSDSGTVTAPLSALPPTIKYDRSYTKSQAGLHALLADIVKDKGNYGISVRQIGGSGWQAEANGGKQFETASTYKLFVAYAVLKRIEANQMSWNDGTSAGGNVSQCFDDMIINSDNACAEAFGQKIGWTTIQNMVRAQGLSQTTLGSTFYSTANDETLFLEKLEKSELLQGASREKLLDAMKRQVYRQGIPAGTGVAVADKVGFLGGLLHDAAIVYAPSGTYAITIMTDGSSWGQIADAARQINNLLK